MSFDITRCDQSECIDTKFKKDMFIFAFNTSEKTGFMRASSIGLKDGLLTVTKRVSLVAENILKGVLNIAGAPLRILGVQCSLQKGLIQILWQTPKHVVIFPFTVVSAVYNLVNTTIEIAIDPKGFAFLQKLKYEIAHQQRLNSVFEDEILKLFIECSKVGCVYSCEESSKLFENLIKSRRKSFKHPYKPIKFADYYYKYKNRLNEDKKFKFDWVNIKYKIGNVHNIQHLLGSSYYP